MKLIIIIMIIIVVAAVVVVVEVAVVTMVTGYLLKHISPTVPQNLCL